VRRHIFGGVASAVLLPKPAPSYSSYKARTTLLLEGKVLAISKDVPNPVNSYTSLAVLLNRCRIVRMLAGSLCVSVRIRRNGDHATVIY
jgi:hypothetical protein